MVRYQPALYVSSEVTQLRVPTRRAAEATEPQRLAGERNSYVLEEAIGYGSPLAHQWLTMKEAIGFMNGIRFDIGILCVNFILSRI